MSDDTQAKVGMTVRVDMPVPSRYINELMNLTCARDWWPFLHKSNAKELTESMGAFAALRTIVGFEAFADEGWTALVPGDGVRARTGALVALRTSWDVHSIDPQADGQTHGVLRLSAWREKLETHLARTLRHPNRSNVAILAVHSHAPLAPVLAMTPFVHRLVVVAVPCCAPQELPFPPVLDKEDRHVWSPKNRVIAWDLERDGSGAWRTREDGFVIGPVDVEQGTRPPGVRSVMECPRKWC